MKHIVLITICLLLPLMGTVDVQAAEDRIIIGAADIAELHAHTLADVLNTVSGISAGTTSVSIHGNSKVKVFVDGRPLNDPTSSHGGVKLDLVTPDEVAKIEILRGKGGVRYGQDASGGVILITTLGQTELSGQIKTYAGNFGQFYSQGNVRASSGPWSSSFSLGYETSDGYKINNDSERKKTGGKLTYQPTDRFTITLSGDYLIYKSGLSGYPAYPTPDSRQQSDLGAYLLTMRYDDVHSKTFFNRGRKVNWDDSRDLYNKIRVDEFGQEFSHHLDADSWGQIDYGLAYFRKTGQGSSFSKQTEETFSAFALHSISHHNWSLNVGLRGNHYSAFDDSLNPEIKLGYQANSWHTSLSYNRTNNTPSFYKRYRETSSMKPNPDLGMETADNFSLVVGKELSEKITLGGTLFYNLLHDRISYIRTAGVGQYQNLGEVSYCGVDLSLQWQLASFLKLRANYTYMKAKDEESGLYLTAKPRHSGRVELAWRVLENLNTLLVMHGKSEAYTTSDNEETSPGYLLTDVRTEYQLGRYTLFAEVTNVTDKDYLYVDGLEAPPREWFAGVTAKF